MKTVSSLIAAMAFGLATTQTNAAAFDQFYAFGDSTLDSGWWKGALNGQCGGVPRPVKQECRTKIC